MTTQHDARTVYKRKRMPSRKRNSWKRFRSKVLAVSEKDMGTQTVVINQGVSASNVAPGAQLLWTCALYPATSADSLFNDMNRIGQLNNTAVTTPGTGLAISNSTKILFQSGILDITFRNASTFNNGTSTGPDSRARMEVDIYEISARLGDEAGVIYDNLLSLFAQNPIRTDSIGGGGVELSLVNRGVAPFDLTYALSRFKIKIWRKTKYQVSNGDQFTYQVRDPRRHVMLQRDLTSTEGWVLKPTRTILVVARVSPGLPIGAGPNTFQEVLDVGVTRKYSYKVENWSEDRTSYLT